MNALILVDAAGAALFLFYTLVLLAPRGRSLCSAPSPRAFLALVFLELAFSFGTSIAEALNWPDSVLVVLVSLSNLYGLPALAHFVGAVRPGRRRWIGFLPVAASVSLAVAYAIYTLVFPSADARPFYMVYGVFLISSAIAQALWYLPRCFRAIVRKKSNSATGSSEASLGAPEGALGRRKGLVRRVGLTLIGAYVLVSIWIVLGLASDLGSAALGLDLSGFDVWLERIGYLLAIGFAFFSGLSLLALPWDEDGGPEDRHAAEPADLPAPGKYRKLPLDEDGLVRLAARLREWLSGQENLSGERASPKRIAEELRVPYHHLSAACNHAKPGGIRAFVAEARLDRAERLLVERPDLAILDVALEAGFSAKSSFNEAWAARHEDSPRDWRSKVLAGRRDSST